MDAPPPPPKPGPGLITPLVFEPEPVLFDPDPVAFAGGGLIVARIVWLLGVTMLRP